MKFPVTVKNKKDGHRVKIYAPGSSFPYYRAIWRFGGQRKVRTFASYSPAKEFAETTARALDEGSAAPALTAREAADALVVRDILKELAQDTGRTVNVVEAVRAYAAALSTLKGHSLTDAVKSYMAAVGSVTRKPLAEAAEEFITALEKRTIAPDGKRPELTVKHADQTGRQLRRFAASFTGTVVCDLERPHIDAFMDSLKELSPRSRNYHRATLSVFCKWAQRKDYLPANHRLADADGTRLENATPTKPIEIYSPEDFRKLLAAADDTLRPLVAIAGLAGLRTEELFRLTWHTVWGTPGYLEVCTGLEKTKRNRLVMVAPSLAARLEPYRGSAEGLVWPSGDKGKFHAAMRDLCERAGVERQDNALRHSFCTYHVAAHNDVNLTAAQAGNSPAVIYRSYRKPTTAETARRWFDTAPSAPVPAPA